MKTISKRFLKGSLAILLAVIMLFSSTITGFAAVVDNAETKANVDVAETSASIAAGTNLYLKPSSDWTGGSARFAAYFYGNGEAWVSMTKLPSGIYVCTSPSNKDYTNVIFCRMNGSASANNWNNKWNQTGNLTWDGSKSLFIINNGTWDGQTSGWNEFYYSLPGSFNSWNTATDRFTISGTTATLTKELSANDYEFKIYDSQGNWKGCKNTINDKTTNALTFNTDDNCNLTASGGTYTFTLDITTNKLTVTYVPAGYSYTTAANPTAGGSVNPASGTATSVEIKAEAKTGYRFVNWTVTSGSVDDPQSASTTFTVSSNGAVATANFAAETYKVTLNTNDGTINSGNVTTYTYGVGAKLPTDVTKAGYTFDGWYTESSFTNKVDVISTEDYGNKEFFAKFVMDSPTKPEAPTVTVVEPLGGSGTEGDPYLVLPSTEYKLNVSGTVPTDATGIAYNVNYEYSPVNINGTSVEYKVPWNLYVTLDEDKTLYVYLWSYKDDGVDEKYSKEHSTTTIYVKGAYPDVTVSANAAYTDNGTDYTDGTIGGTVTAPADKVPYGSEVTLTASNEIGYRFVEWVDKDGNYVSNESSYTFKANADVTYTARFVKQYTITVYRPADKFISVTLNGETENTADKIIAPVDAGGSFNISALTNTGWRFTRWVNANNDTVAEINEYEVTNVQSAMELTPVADPVYVVSVPEDVTAQGTGSYKAGVTVNIIVTCPEGQYLSSASLSSSATSAKIDIPTSTITFIMPEEPVVVSPSFVDLHNVLFDKESGLEIIGRNDKGYYPGEDVSITVEAKTGVMLNGLATDNEALVVTKNSDGSYTISGKMPSSNVNIAVDSKATFQVSYEQVAVGNYKISDTVFGTVTITDESGNEIKSGGDVDQQPITFTATETNDQYTFAGFYSDKDCTINLSYDKIYTVTPDKATKVYALFARKHYIAYDRTNTNAFASFAYDPKKGVYTHTVSLGNNSGTGTLSRTAWFKVTNDTSSETTWNNYHGATLSNFTVTFGSNVASTNDNLGYCWKLTDISNDTNMLTITLDPNKNVAITVSANTQDTSGYTKVFLSSGRRDLADNMSDKFGSSSEFVSENVHILGTTPISRSWNEAYGAGTNTNIESYTVALVAENESRAIKVKTTIDSTKSESSNFFVKCFVLYHSNGVTERIDANAVGDYEYEGLFNLEEDRSNVLVTPIFWYKESYFANQTNKRAITVYFDRTDANANWGPLVSCYPYGADTTNNISQDIMGGWPGQLMIPQDRAGIRWMTQFVVDTNEFTPQAVTFCNYLCNSTPNANKTDLNLNSYTSDRQTFDYGEPVYLFNEKYSTITFRIKTGTSYRYHNAISKKDDYTYELLVNESGEAMSFTTGKIDNPATDPADADFFVVTGENKYVKNPEALDPEYAGNWSIDWVVFDKNGKRITQLLSGYLYKGIGENEDGTDGTSLFVEQLINALRGTEGYIGMSDAEIKEKIAQSTVAISYNHQGDGIRHDGQWYGTRPNKKYEIKVETLLRDGTTYTPSGTNTSSYGEAYVNGKASDTFTVNTNATLTANALVDGNDYYRFVGWYTKDGGKYYEQDTRNNINPVVNSNQTYYAMFEKLSNGTVLVSHQRYDYSGVDTAVHSHNGSASLKVDVYACDANGNVSNSTPIKSSSPHSFNSNTTFNSVQGNYYKIVLTAEVDKDTTFHAWYSKTKTVSGEETFEEVLTEGVFEKGATATTSFVYKASGAADAITIYADAITPGIYTTLVYTYKDRFGKEATWTVKDVMYNDDERTGYDGNGINQFYPTYITEYKMSNGKETKKFYGTDGYNTAKSTGYTIEVDSYNMISKYAPTAKQVDVYDSILSWTIVHNDTLRATSSKTILVATQNDPIYYINYSYDDVNGVETGTYNTLLNNKIVAKATNSKEQKFSYWEEVTEVNGKEITEIVSYTRQYNYRITENKTIRAVYGVQVKEWTPIIDSVRKSRELSDNSDYIYTDYLLSYSNSNGKVLDEVKGEEGIKYGLMLVYDPAVAKSNLANGYKDTSFVQLDTVAELIKDVAIGGQHKSIYDTANNNKQYNTYCFDLSKTDTTVFNRLDYYLRYTNEGKYDKYNFTAVAYIMIDNNNDGKHTADEVILSNAEFVNFYNEANP